jgi:hypothetical protein
MAVAELAADLDALEGMKDPDARWQRLRELCRELARLQNGFNRSRWTELAWTKRNDTLRNGENSNETQTCQTHLPNSNVVVPNRAQSCDTPTTICPRGSLRLRLPKMPFRRWTLSLLGRGTRCGRKEKFRTRSKKRRRNILSFRLALRLHMQTVRLQKQGT